MTINKSQGQTFKAVGVDLTNESFTHGMLYVAAVALSRVGSPNCLTLLFREGRKTMLFIVRFLIKYNVCLLLCALY